LFSSAKKKGARTISPPVWKHKFVCLPYKDQKRIPTTDIEKYVLLKCGLGEKVVEFIDIDVDAAEFMEVIINEFPKLRNCGGYMFFKCAPNTCTLEPLSETVLSSPKMLKERVGSFRTYIRPLQKDLELSHVTDIPKGVSLK
jgi:hypothetical protein